MLYKKALLILLIFTPCRGMEKTQESKTTTKITIITQDNEFVDVPDSCIPLCKLFKDMLEDFKDLQPQKHEIRLQGIAQDVKAVFSLLEGKQSNSETQYEHSIQGYPLVDLARTVALVNFLDCPTIFADVLDVLSQKIDQIKHSAGSELWEQLEEILPRDLQKMIQEIILIGYASIIPLIKTTHRIKHPTDWEGDYWKTRKIICSPKGNFILVSAENLSNVFKFYLYDVLGRLIWTDTFLSYPYRIPGFSADEKYFLYSNGEGTIVLLSLETLHVRKFGRKLYWVDSDCVFSQDSKAFLIDGIAHSVETGLPLENSGYKFDTEEQESSTVAQPDWIALIKQKHEYLIGDLKCLFQNGRFMVILAKRRGVICVFDIAKPEMPCIFCTEASFYFINYEFFAYQDNLLLHKPGKYDCDFEVGQIYDEVIHIDLRTRRKHQIPTHSLVAGFAPDKFLTFSIRGKLQVHCFIASISQWILLDIPHQFVRCGSGRAEGMRAVLSCSFANFDSDYMILHGGRHPKQECAPSRVIEMQYFPLELLVKKCTLQEMMMVINYAQNPALLNDPYYKRLYDNLHADVRRFLDLKTIV